MSRGDPASAALNKAADERQPIRAALVQAPDPMTPAENRRGMDLHERLLNFSKPSCDACVAWPSGWETGRVGRKMTSWIDPSLIEPRASIADRYFTTKPRPTIWVGSRLASAGCLLAPTSRSWRLLHRYALFGPAPCRNR